jgi:hypothetical protein
LNGAFQHSDNARYGAFLIFAGEGVFPNAQYAPFFATQNPGDFEVTVLIARYFCNPKLPVAFGDASVQGASMPKTTVHKNRDALLGENKIRFPIQFEITPPAGNPVRFENFDKPQFGVFIPRAPHTRHHFRTLGFCKNVGHGEKRKKVNTPQNNNVRPRQM